MNTKEFVKVWQSSSSAIEVAEHFDVSPASARAKAAYIRGRYKIELKDMRKIDFDVEELRELVAA